MGLLDSPKRIVVVVHGETSDRLQSTSPGIVDVVGVQAE